MFQMTELKVLETATLLHSFYSTNSFKRNFGTFLSNTVKAYIGFIGKKLVIVFKLKTNKI